MFLNKNWGNGLVILLLVIVGVFLVPKESLGAFLLPSVIGGVFAIVFSRLVFSPKEKGNK